MAARRRRERREEEFSAQQYWSGEYAEEKGGAIELQEMEREELIRKVSHINFRPWHPVRK